MIADMTPESFPASLPEPHRRFLVNLLRVLPEDQRLVGVAAGGSYLTDSMDEFSDLDLVLAIEPRDYAEVMEGRESIAGSFGPLLAAFTGEHVGEPRLLICLYGPPTLHVDLKFVRLEDSAQRIEDPAVLWEREGRLSEALRKGQPEYPEPDPQWIEDRFWTWVHYTAAKIGRGELFEALGCLAFLREKVLGPLGALRAGKRPAGARRIETATPELADRLRETIARYDAAEGLRALRACVDLYREVRPQASLSTLGEGAEAAAMELVERLGRQSKL